jgi:EAL domain-containing protein (putative c-di-GMP-specific phosphodiesterase class I)
MRIVKTNIEARLVDFVNSVRDVDANSYVVHFRFSKLSEMHKNDFQIKIAVNILKDIFGDEPGEILKLDNYDVFVIYQGDSKTLLNKAIFQLRYLFFDDPLANLPNGTENKDFCEVYDLNFQWAEFSQLSSRIMSESMQKTFGKDVDEEVYNNASPKLLANLVEELDNTRLDGSIRRQPICSYNDDGKIKPIFHEIYINIPHLQNSISTNIALTGNKWLFMYLTQKLDEKVIETISINPENFLYMPISLNLNLDTVLSKDFSEFCEIVKDFKCQIVVEIGVADVFSDIGSFFKAKDLCAKMNHKICIDGLNNDAFVQVNRKSLGFDLAKLQWNADFKTDLENGKENQQLIDAIQSCGGNRLILCRCDDVHAIDYGEALGINLFQGRYPDRILNPNSMVLN